MALVGDISRPRSSASDVPATSAARPSARPGPAVRRRRPSPTAPAGRARTMAASFATRFMPSMTGLTRITSASEGGDRHRVVRSVEIQIGARRARAAVDPRDHLAHRRGVAPYSRARSSGVLAWTARKRTLPRRSGRRCRRASKARKPRSTFFDGSSRSARTISAGLPTARARSGAATRSSTAGPRRRRQRARDPSRSGRREPRSSGRASGRPAGRIHPRVAHEGVDRRGSSWHSGRSASRRCRWPAGPRRSPAAGPAAATQPGSTAGHGMWLKWSIRLAAAGPGSSTPPGTGGSPAAAPPAGRAVARRGHRLAGEARSTDAIAALPGVDQVVVDDRVVGQLVQLVLDEPQERVGDLGVVGLPGARAAGHAGPARRPGRAAPLDGRPAARRLGRLRRSASSAPASRSPRPSAPLIQVTGASRPSSASAVTRPPEPRWRAPLAVGRVG